MIESIEIKNFRCFKDIKIAKFGLVNLFGGLNNAGKTALLEAIFLAKSPYPQPIRDLRSTLRGESHIFIKEKPENTWDNFFYDKDKTQSIQIFITDTEERNRKLSLKCDEKINDFVDSFQGKEDKEASNYINQLSISKKSVLHIDVENDKSESFSSVLVASEAGIGGNSSKTLMVTTTHFLLSTKKVEYSNLAKIYEIARYEGKDQHILKACQIIDKSIEDIDVFSIGEPIIHLTLNNGLRLPLSLFGDAIGKVVSFILSIVIHPNTILLIDEIENGIHYTKQAELWEMLFKLAIEFDVQIFSTSHSLEMIKAFANIAKEFPEQAAYFEMARHYKTGNIIGTSISMDDLKYYIESNSPFRGD